MEGNRIISIGVLKDIKNELMINEVENQPRIIAVQKLINHFVPIEPIYENGVRKCPVCGGRIVYADQKCCDECGQAIKL